MFFLVVIIPYYQQTEYLTIKHQTIEHYIIFCGSIPDWLIQHMGKRNMALDRYMEEDL